ncbi:MAG: hypothetical protein V7K92_14425, partial [Nostoc sp.]|uniref:hypothetical protein n=1 Tax=Nostoc sp. TaxID=1180 RepID=UPI002FF30B60
QLTYPNACSCIPNHQDHTLPASGNFFSEITLFVEQIQNPQVIKFIHRVNLKLQIQNRLTNYQLPITNSCSNKDSLTELNKQT